MNWWLIVLAVYVFFAAGFLVVALFGRNPCFEGTCVEHSYIFISGAWFDDFLLLLRRSCPSRVAALVEETELYCCQKRNPFLPALYLGLLVGTYWLYWQHVFEMLPTTFTPSWHRYTGSATAALSLVCWALAAFSDPGRITPELHAAWAARDPAGNHVFPEKVCHTCQRPRPGRSKHCGLCGACVARHDHHCAWINNCVGAYNLRWFLAFVAANCIMTAYGAALAAAALLGFLWDRGLADARYFDKRTGRHELMRRNAIVVLRLVMRSFPVQLMLVLALALTATVLSGFCAYHIYSIHVGITGTEQYKLGELRRAMALQMVDDEPGEGKQFTWRRLFTRAPRSELQLPEFPYKQPAWQNWREALFPATIGLSVPEDSARGRRSRRKPKRS